MPYFKINNPLLLPPPLVVSPWFGKKFKFMPLRLLEMQNINLEIFSYAPSPWQDSPHDSYHHPLGRGNLLISQPVIFGEISPPPPQQKAIKMVTLHTTETKEEQ